jgi:transposase-like protein
VVIVQPFFGSVKEYIATVLAQGCPFPVPERCAHPDCPASGSLIRWGTYERGALTGEADHRIRIQRVRCKVCGRTHSLLPDFLHPHRHFVISLLQQVVSLYLLAGLGWRQLMRWLRKGHRRGPTRSTVREWVASFAYGAGYLLLDALLRHLLALDPGIDLPDPPPQHLDRVPDADRRRRLKKAHTFRLLAEQLYALVKQRQPDLHFSAAQILPFLLHWLQGRRLLPRLFWSSCLTTTPTRPF